MILTGHKHKYRPATSSDDGCLASTHRCECGAAYKKRKRRPANVPDTQCTWHPSIYCSDHPTRGNT